MSAEAAEKRVHVAFVLLSTPTLPRGEDIVRAYAGVAPKKERIRVVEVKDAKKDIVTLELTPGGDAFVALMPVAVPKGEADEAARFSLSSFGRGWKLPPHKAHLIVTLMDTSGAKAVDSLSRFTSLTAAVTEASHAVGVYCGNAGATHDPKFFVEVARDPGIMARLTVWTGVSVAKEGARISFLSLGMKQLELPDLLLTAPASGKDALPTMFDLLAYVIDRGKPLPEGDTVGRSAEERFPVHYVPSPIDPKTKVWRVDMK